MVYFRILMIAFLVAIFIQPEANSLFLSECRELDKSCLTKKLCEASSGGTINTEIDMRGEQYLIVNTEDPKIFITRVLIIGSDQKETRLEGCMLQKCSYNLENFLLPDAYIVRVTTSTDWSFSGSFNRN